MFTLSLFLSSMALAEKEEKKEEKKNGMERLDWETRLETNWQSPKENWEKEEREVPKANRDMPQV